MTTPEVLSTHAKAYGTYIVTITFTDEDDVAEDVKTLTWSLTNLDGDEINSRTNEVVAAPGSSEDIVLSGADLAANNDAKTIEFTFKATYDSALANDLPLHGGCRIVIDAFQVDMS